jgi:hypothetical protein
MGNELMWKFLFSDRFLDRNIKVIPMACQRIMQVSVSIEHADSHIFGFGDEGDGLPISSSALLYSASGVASQKC